VWLWGKDSALTRSWLADVIGVSCLCVVEDRGESGVREWDAKIQTTPPFSSICSL